MSGESMAAKCLHGDVPGTTTLERAAALIGIEPKRLRGRIWRNSVMQDDPRGCPHCGMVYVDSLRAGERGSVTPEVTP